MKTRLVDYKSTYFFKDWCFFVCVDRHFRYLGLVCLKV